METTRDVEDRLETKAAYFGADHDGDLCREAAAEIRRLRSELDELDELAQQNATGVRSLRSEVERMVAALREAPKPVNGKALNDPIYTTWYHVVRGRALATGGDEPARSCGGCGEPLKHVGPDYWTCGRPNCPASSQAMGATTEPEEES